MWCENNAEHPAADWAKNARLNPANGSVQVAAASSGVIGALQVACPDKTKCLAIGNAGKSQAILAINTKTGVEQATAKLPTADQYNLFSISCPSAKYCWVDGSSAAPGVQLPTWALLLKVSPAGKILQRTVNKSYYMYGPIACESSTICLAGRETNKIKFQSVTLVNGKFGRAYWYPANYLPFGAACYSGRLCYSIGTIETNSPIDAEVIPLNPKTGAPGKALRLPFTSSTSVGVANSIACYSATQCVATGAIGVGSGANQGTEAAYVLITNGKVGKPVVASKALASVFSSVSCASAKECYAVGTYYLPGLEDFATIVSNV